MTKKQDLINDLRNLGIKEGDVLFVRISMKAIGKVEGGGNTVIDAILDVLGPSGTLIATAFPSRQKDFLHRLSKKNIYQPGMRPVTGIISSLMCQYPAAFFSFNPITPFVAIGGQTEAITSAHTPQSGPYSLIDNVATNYCAKCLRVGGNVLVGTTHLAFTAALKSIGAYQKRVAEGMYYYDHKILRYMKKDISCFCYDQYRHFFDEYLKDEAVIAKGILGAGEAVVTDMHKTLTIEYKQLLGHPQSLLCNNENCLTCRCSYSYSDNNILSFIIRQIKKRDKNSWDRIKGAIQLFLLGRKCR